MIKVLDKSVSDKIAAGEVIERPVSVIKELLENSLDAGADSITCEIKNGGKTYIRVTDDGCGIPAEDCETAFLRHATSKITGQEDLKRITSLGFRGEALASIAAVTRTTLITRTAEETSGIRLQINGGEVLSKESVGCPQGTTVIVTDLFYNTPARREFLKNDAAEANVVISFLSELALAWKDVRFNLINNGQSVFTTKGNGRVKDAVISIYKKREYDSLIELDGGEDGVHVEGLISRPSLSRPSRKDEITVVNGRVVESSVLSRAISKGYRERLFEGRYPVAFLLITVDPARIDVNIHPNKKEVRFHEEKAVESAVSDVIAAALKTDDAVIEVQDYFTKEKPVSKQKKEQVDIKQILSNMRSESSESAEKGTGLAEPQPASEYAADGPEETPVQNGFDAAAPEKDADAKADASCFDLVPGHVPFDFGSLMIKGSVFDTYLVCETEDSMILIDQHAAQERIFYETLVGRYLDDDKVSQPLLTPVTLELSPAESETFEEWEPELSAMGYVIEEFGPSTFLMKEIPDFMEIGEAESFAYDFISGKNAELDGRNKVVIDKLITRSCKAAIKAHDKLDEREMEALLKDLAACRNPFSCPHGRPTFIRFTTYEIEKFFKRIQ